MRKNFIPESLKKNTQRTYEEFITACAKQDILLPDNEQFIDALIKVFACSQFVRNAFIQNPKFFFDLFNSNDLNNQYNQETYNKKLHLLLKNIDTEAELMSVLRLWRKREMIRIAWRDIVGLADVRETVADLSALADACLIETNIKVHHWQCARYKMDPSSVERLAIIAAGKLGSRELNFSSDIDLVFAFSDKQNFPDIVSMERFYLLVSQQIIKILSSVTAEGIVFRIDLRLRPFGSSGPISVGFSSLEDYYQKHGRDWERYAFTKARVVTGEKNSIKHLAKVISDFVYRKYVDYTVIESLRLMKNKMRNEAAYAVNDIKRSSGGIRECEFIIQTFQLTHGGQEPWFRQTSQFSVLELFGNKQYLPKNVVTELMAAYSFLRNAEHKLQEYADQQTQKLPEDEEGKARLALAMNFNDWLSFENQLIEHKEKIQFHFDSTIAAPEKVTTKVSPVPDVQLIALIKNELSAQQSEQALLNLGFHDASTVIEILADFQQSYNYRAMDKLSKSRLEQLFPLILPFVARTPDPIETLKRLIPLLEAIMRRSVYMVLLLENTLAISHLVELISISSWLAEQITRYPLLLEELTAGETLYAPYSTTTLTNELRQYLLSVAEEDLEQQMEVLRRFKLIQVFRVAIADLKGTLPLMKVSDHLTNTAAAIINFVKSIAWQTMVTRYGFPCHDDQTLTIDDFAVVAYGKLGGIELSYGSDLDLVFLHSDIDNDDMTDGLKPISDYEFFVKLAQRIIHILNTHTASGVLYAVDTRLRPSGKAGMLVSSFNGFAQYQRNEAWTWEHQSIIRARVISGGKELTNEFNNLRAEVLAKKSEPKKLAEEIINMRQRIRETVSPVPKGKYDIVQGIGGIKDIEFLAQFIVLNYAAKYPELYEYTDNIRIFKAAEKVRILSLEDAEFLRETYQVYRRLQHHKILQNMPIYVEDTELLELRRRVEGLWRVVIAE